MIPAAVLGACWLFWPTRQLPGDNFVFYTPTTRRVLNLEIIENTKYLPLLPVLNLFGKVNCWQEKRNAVKVKFENKQLELHKNERKVRVDKVGIELSNPATTAGGQWMVPVDFLTSVLPKLTHQVVEYQAGTNRVFVGDVKPSSYSVRLDPVPNGARLTVQFTDKVSVHTASSNGKWIMYLGDHPFEPLEPVVRFQSAYVSDLEFDDQDGSPKLILTPTSSSLNFYPSLAEEGKVLLADVVKPAREVVQEAPSPPPQPATTPSTPSSGPPQPSPGAEAPSAPPGPPLPVVVLDAGHGGDDTGASSADGVLEKDLTAQLVARVRAALLSSQKYRVVLTRTSDVNVTFEQRATAANVAGAAFFLTFHAGDLGSGLLHIAVYSYQPPSPLPSQPDAGMIFVPWWQVQNSHLEQSRAVAAALAQRFEHLTGTSAESPASAPVRALRSVNAPAVAIEIGSLSPSAPAGALVEPGYLQRISKAVVEALATFEEKGA